MDEPARPASDPYSAARIKRGAVHLIGGKALTALAGLGTFLLLVRELPVEQFGAYTILFGLIELVDAVSGLGASQILSRYVPELLVERRHAALRRVVAMALAFRVIVLAIFLASVFALAPLVFPLVGLGDWQWAAKAYLAVVFVRVVELSLFSVLESMLLQAIAQLGFSFVTALRFGLLVVAAAGGGFGLETVIAIELATDLVGCGILLIGLMRRIPRHPGRTDEDATAWFRGSWKRMSDFGLKGYAQHLLIVPYAGSTNRLLVGGTLASAEVALFGFAQSVTDLIYRYLPANLLVGIIRPVLTARYVRDRQFASLERAANLIFKINATLICAAAIVIFAGGEPMLDVVTRGKYHAGAVSLLLLMCALLLAYSMRSMLDHVCHALERNGPLIWANALMLLSLLPGIALLPVVGIYALPSANLTGAVLACATVAWRLRREGFHFHYDFAGLARLLGAVCFAMLGAAVLRVTGAGWITVAGLALAGFAVGLHFWQTFQQFDRQLIVAMIRGGRGRS
ncbi:MAG: lipopolysaccharide biosynthesis protein [Burkholderiales bacterium]|nr:lipopolysaccharide biosynthesis protein [Burkholderiales bacterium]